MVVDPLENLGVVIIGVNNPHLQEVESYRLCSEEIDDHPLLANVYHPNDIRKGIIYACEVAQAQKVIQEIPTDLTINGVLS